MNFPFSQVKVGLYLSHAQLLERTDENGTQDLQKGWFYAPTQVVLLFVEDALCWEC